MVSFFEDINSAGSLKSGGNKKHSLNKDRGVVRSHTVDDEYQQDAYLSGNFPDVQEERPSPSDIYNYEEDFMALDINEDNIDINAVKGKICILANTNQGSRFFFFFFTIIY